MGEDMSTTLNGVGSSVGSMQTQQTSMGHSFANVSGETLDYQVTNVNSALSTHRAIAVVSGTSEDLNRLDQIVLSYEQNEQTLRADVARLEGALQGAENDLNVCETEIKECYAEIDKLNDEIKKKTQEITRCQEKGLVDAETIDTLNKNILALTEELKKQRGRADELSKGKDDLTKTYNTAKANLERANKKIEELTSAIQALLNNIKSLEESRSKKDWKCGNRFFYYRHNIYYAKWACNDNWWSHMNAKRNCRTKCD